MSGPGAQEPQPAGAAGAPAPLRAVELIDALIESGADYVIIGGFALAAHGVVRGTKDIDIVPAPEPDNLRRLAAALARLGAEHYDLGDFDPDEFPIGPDFEGLSAGGNFVLRTRLGRLDVLQDVKGVDSYGDLRARAVSFHVPGTIAPVPFAGFTDLIRMKGAAGRPQDEIDISDLKAARGGLRPEG